MGTTETKIAETISVYGMWIIIILLIIFVFACGIYSLLKKLIKLEKQKKEEKIIILQKINYTNQLLENILNNQTHTMTNSKFENNNNINNQQNY